MAIAGVAGVASRLLHGRSVTDRGMRAHDDAVVRIASGTAVALVVATVGGGAGAVLSTVGLGRPWGANIGLVGLRVAGLVVTVSARRSGGLWFSHRLPSRGLTVGMTTMMGLAVHFGLV